MRVIEINASKWKSVDDFYDALFAAVGAPKGHGRSPDALIDSMVWGGMNSVEPPYIVKLSGAATLPQDVRSRLETARRVLAEGRADHQKLRRSDVEVSIEVEP